MVLDPYELQDLVISIVRISYVLELFLQIAYLDMISLERSKDLVMIEYNYLEPTTYYPYSEAMDLYVENSLVCAST
ncbi:MAG: hypothetical protein EBS49_02955 [Verrucomicrobia bacterium]|nr:hypothetical protein [Verrucomicrobiota bacterium]